MNDNDLTIEDLVKFIFFSIFFLPIIVYYFFNFFCHLRVVTPLPEPKKPKPIPTPEPEGCIVDEIMEPELDVPKTDEKLIDEVVSALCSLGFKKKEAKVSVLKACEGMVFEDHQSLIEAAMKKSNV